MRLVVCAVYDIAAAAYGRPVFAVARSAALRSFSDEINRGAPDNMLSMHPEDFQLFYFGHWDDGDGVFSLLQVPELIARAVDLRRDVQGADNV